MKFSRKMQLMLILKTKLYILFRQYIFWNIFWKLRRRFILNKISILFFAELAIFHYIQIKTSWGKIVKKNHKGKGLAPDICFLVFADVCFLVFWHMSNPDNMWANIKTPRRFQNVIIWFAYCNFFLLFHCHSFSVCIIFVTPQSAFTCSEVNNGNNKTMYKICSRFTVKTPEWR